MKTTTFKRTTENNGYGRVYRDEEGNLIYKAPCYLSKKPVWVLVNKKTNKSRFFEKLNLAKIGWFAFDHDSEAITK